MIVNVDEFVGRYERLWDTGGAKMIELQRNIQTSGAFTDIPNDVQRDLDFAEITYLRRAGQQAEDVGDMEEALTLYLKSIRLGESSSFDMLHAYQYSYDLALAIIRSNGAMERERALLTALLCHGNVIDHSRYVTRLNEISA